MERSGTSLEEEARNHKEHAHAIDSFTTVKHMTAEMRRACCTVNQRNTVEENCTEYSTRDKILEHAFVRVDVLAADAHESVNREASEFHGNEESDKVDSLRHEQGTACSKHHKAISFTTLELFTAKRPLQTRNTEECAEKNSHAKHAADWVHCIEAQERFGLGIVQSNNAQNDKERRNPRKHLVLVFVIEERFGSESHHAAQNHKNNRQEINKIT